MNVPVLEGQGLECTRGGRVLFEQLNLRVQGGQGLYIAGGNGAGKTSLLRLLCGLLPPSAGQVLWQGAPLAQQREQLGRDLVYIGHLNGVKDDLTALENLHFAAALSGRPATAEQLHHALELLGLGARAKLPARVLSQGQRRRLALARLVLAQEVPLWILDEPFTALDTAGVVVLRGLIEAQLARGGIVVLTTHQEVALPTSVLRLELELHALERHP